MDLILFRADQGGDPDKIRELQKKRFKDVSHVEKVIEADTRWRKCEPPAYYFYLETGDSVGIESSLFFLPLSHSEVPDG